MNNSLEKFFLPAKSRILTGKELADWLVCSYIPKDIRRAYRDLQSYIQGEYPDHVCFLSGLSGTGKKSLIRRAMLELPTDQTVYINIKEGEKSKDVDELVSQMVEKHKIAYIFIVNITRMEDFVGIDVLLQRYCNYRVRIIITGDSNLAISVCNRSVYLDRYGNEFVPKVYKIDTTKISYQEHAMMTGNDSLDHYLMTAGTCPTEDRGESGKTVFEQDKLAKSYVSTAIVSNIIVGADVEEQCGKYYSMIRTMEGSKVAINNIINNIVHGMVRAVSNNKEIDKNLWLDAQVNHYCTKRTASSETLHALREIGALSAYSNCIYLGSWESSFCLHLTQPGLCYWIAEKYVCDSFAKEDQKQILAKVRARILEDMVVFWFIQSSKENLVYRLSCGNGGTAVLVHSRTDSDNCYLYEFVHSDTNSQSLIIHDVTLFSSIEKQFGIINKKGIIWEGKDKVSDNIDWCDVRQFLSAL